MESVHPLFFEWTANPIRDIGIRREAAFGLYFATNVVLLGGVAFFGKLVKLPFAPQCKVGVFLLQAQFDLRPK